MERDISSFYNVEAELWNKNNATETQKVPGWVTKHKEVTHSLESWGLGCEAGRNFQSPASSRIPRYTKKSPDSTLKTHETSHELNLNT